jgi:hypothetical protein
LAEFIIKQMNNEQWTMKKKLRLKT